MATPTGAGPSLPHLQIFSKSEDSTPRYRLASPGALESRDALIKFLKDQHLIDPQKEEVNKIYIHGRDADTMPWQDFLRNLTGGASIKVVTKEIGSVFSRTMGSADEEQAPVVSRAPTVLPRRGPAATPTPMPPLTSSTPTSPRAAVYSEEETKTKAVSQPGKASETTISLTPMHNISKIDITTRDLFAAPAERIIAGDSEEEINKLRPLILPRQQTKLDEWLKGPRSEDFQTWFATSPKEGGGERVIQHIHLMGVPRKEREDNRTVAVRKLAETYKKAFGSLNEGPIRISILGLNKGYSLEESVAAFALALAHSPLASKSIEIICPVEHQAEFKAAYERHRAVFAANPPDRFLTPPPTPGAAARPTAFPAPTAPPEDFVAAAPMTPTAPPEESPAAAAPTAPTPRKPLPHISSSVTDLFRSRGPFVCDYSQENMEKLRSLLTEDGQRMLENIEKEVGSDKSMIHIFPAPFVKTGQPIVLAELGPSYELDTKKLTKLYHGLFRRIKQNNVPSCTMRPLGLDMGCTIEESAKAMFKALAALPLGDRHDTINMVFSSEDERKAFMSALK